MGVWDHFSGVNSPENPGTFTEIRGSGWGPVKKMSKHREFTRKWGSTFWGLGWNFVKNDPLFGVKVGYFSGSIPLKIQEHFGKSGTPRSYLEKKDTPIWGEARFGVWRVGLGVRLGSGWGLGWVWGGSGWGSAWGAGPVLEPAPTSVPAGRAGPAGTPGAGRGTGRQGRGWRPCPRRAPRCLRPLPRVRSRSRSSAEPGPR